MSLRDCASMAAEGSLRDGGSVGYLKVGIADTLSHTAAFPRPPIS